MKHPAVTPALGSRDACTAMDLMKCIGGCLPLFLVAVACDVLGVILLFVGIFANVRLEGRFYGDFFIYTGALVVFFSLACWLMWYVGNVQVSQDGDEDGGARKRSRSSSLVELAWKMSARLSHKLKGEGERVKCVEDENRSRPASPPRKASRVTWGKSTAYDNTGYDDSMDSPDVEKNVATM